MNIQQAAAKLSISTDQIRRWERLGMIPPIERSRNGLREIGAGDLEWLEFAKTLSTKHVSQDFMIEYVKLARLGHQATPARRTLLKEQLGQLAHDHQRLVNEINHIESLVKEKQII